MQFRRPPIACMAVAAQLELIAMIAIRMIDMTRGGDSWRQVVIDIRSSRGAARVSTWRLHDRSGTARAAPRQDRKPRDDAGRPGYMAVS